MWGKRTPCHKECNRAQIMSSRKTRCHGMSSPVDYSKESNTALCRDQKELGPLTKTQKPFVWNERKWFWTVVALLQGWWQAWGKSSRTNLAKSIKTAWETRALGSYYNESLNDKKNLLHIWNVTVTPTFLPYQQWVDSHVVRPARVSGTHGGEC